VIAPRIERVDVVSGCGERGNRSHVAHARGTREGRDIRRRSAAGQRGGASQRKKTYVQSHV
jgi:hypothetical protein